MGFVLSGELALPRARAAASVLGWGLLTGDLVQGTGEREQKEGTSKQL